MCCGILYHIYTAHFHLVIRSLSNYLHQGCGDLVPSCDSVGPRAFFPWRRSTRAEGHEGFRIQRAQRRTERRDGTAQGVPSSLDNATAFSVYPSCFFLEQSKRLDLFISITGVWPSLFDDFNLIEGRPLLVARHPRGLAQFAPYEYCPPLKWCSPTNSRRTTAKRPSSAGSSLHLRRRCRRGSAKCVLHSFPS